MHHATLQTAVIFQLTVIETETEIMNFRLTETETETEIISERKRKRKRKWNCQNWIEIETKIISELKLFKYANTGLRKKCPSLVVGCIKSLPMELSVFRQTIYTYQFLIRFPVSRMLLSVSRT